MNLNQIINMVIRQLTRRAVNFGINKGMSTLAGRGKAAGPGTKTAAPDSGAAKAGQADREMVKRARQSARITRRLGR
ncbi:MAG: hypothetical protein Q4G25_15270 [Paracoccus sp. (in: a-proteobacteria)]|nr:hypothetical protein [Paracoccus sp. (in: a-proteobacteria)]